MSRQPALQSFNNLTEIKISPKKFPLVVTRTHHYRRQVEHDNRIDQAMIRLGELAFQSFGHIIPQRATPNLTGSHSENI
jgi:hypothetical protein